MIATMETINMQSWQATENHVCAGWHLRLSGGYSRRGNSVFTHDYDETISLDSAITHCESIYNAQNLPVIFRTTEASQPANLELILEERGYTKEGPSIVKTFDLSSDLAGAHPDFTISSQFEDEWLGDYMRFNNVAPHLYDSHKGIISGMPDCYYGRIGDAALGMIVKIEEWVSFYDIVVNPDKRGQGYGKFIMQSLLRQAQITGAKKGILSVDGENPAAIHLYDSLGFESRYDYNYYRQTFKK